MNLFPSILLPLIAKKMSFFFTLELLKEIPEKKNFTYFFINIWKIIF